VSSGVQFQDTIITPLSLSCLLLLAALWAWGWAELARLSDKNICAGGGGRNPLSAS
jgi:hypothetical protein